MKRTLFIALLLAAMPLITGSLFAYDTEIENAFISPDGLYIVVKTNDDKLRILDQAGNELHLIESLKTGEPDEDESPWAIPVHVTEIFAVSPGAEQILVYSFYNGVQLINREGLILSDLEKPPLRSPGPLNKARFSASGEFLAVCGTGQSTEGNEVSYVALYNTEGKIITFAILPTNPFQSDKTNIAVNEKKQMIIVHPPFTNFLIVVSYKSKPSVQVLKIPGSRPEVVTLSPDGSLVAWFAIDRKIYRAPVNNLKNIKLTPTLADGFYPEVLQFIETRRQNNLIVACDGHNGLVWVVPRQENNIRFFASHDDESTTYRCSIAPSVSPNGLILFFGGNKIRLCKSNGEVIFSRTIVPEEESSPENDDLENDTPPIPDER